MIGMQDSFVGFIAILIFFLITEKKLYKTPLIFSRILFKFYSKNANASCSRKSDF